MPQKDDEAAKLEHAKEIGLVIHPAGDLPMEVVKPSEDRSIFQRRQ